MDGLVAEMLRSTRSRGVCEVSTDAALVTTASPTIEALDGERGKKASAAEGC